MNSLHSGNIAGSKRERDLVYESRIKRKVVSFYYWEMKDS